MQLSALLQPYRHGLQKHPKLINGVDSVPQRAYDEIVDTIIIAMMGN
jgi:hypothetical protein